MTIGWECGVNFTLYIYIIMFIIMYNIAAQNIVCSPSILTFLSNFISSVIRNKAKYLYTLDCLIPPTAFDLRTQKWRLTCCYSGACDCDCGQYILSIRRNWASNRQHQPILSQRTWCVMENLRETRAVSGELDCKPSSVTCLDWSCIPLHSGKPCGLKSLNLLMSLV